MKDPIERQEVMDAIYKCTDIYVNNLPIMIYKAELYKAILELSPAQPEMNFDEWCTDCKEYDHEKHCCPRRNRVIRQALKDAQPERLTDDDFETIRIHLNAYKEKLCNQGRWKEAEEYQSIIDRFMTFAVEQKG